MEICKIKISKDLIQLLVDNEIIRTDDFELIGVDENAFDYSANEIWKAQKSKSDKEFKKLKEVEFKIRNPE